LPFSKKYFEKGRKRNDAKNEREAGRNEGYAERKMGWELKRER
jgi:hypothetical protein